jgi:hypothetical protein
VGILKGVSADVDSFAIPVLTNRSATRAQRAELNAQRVEFADAPGAARDSLQAQAPSTVVAVSQHVTGDGPVVANASGVVTAKRNRFGWKSKVAVVTLGGAAAVAAAAYVAYKNNPEKFIAGMASKIGTEKTEAFLKALKIRPDRQTFSRLLSRMISSERREQITAFLKTYISQSAKPELMDVTGKTAHPRTKAILDFAATHVGFAASYVAAVAQPRLELLSTKIGNNANPGNAFALAFLPFGIAGTVARLVTRPNSAEKEVIREEEADLAAQDRENLEERNVQRRKAAEAEGLRASMQAALPGKHQRSELHRLLGVSRRKVPKEVTLATRPTIFESNFFY